MKLFYTILLGNYHIKFYKEITYSILLGNYQIKFYLDIILYDFIWKLSYTILLGNYLCFVAGSKVWVQVCDDIVEISDDHTETIHRSCLYGR